VCHGSKRRERVTSDTLVRDSVTRGRLTRQVAPRKFSPRKWPLSYSFFKRWDLAHWVVIGVTRFRDSGHIPAQPICP